MKSLQGENNLLLPPVCSYSLPAKKRSAVLAVCLFCIASRAALKGRCCRRLSLLFSLSINNSDGNRPTEQKQQQQRDISLPTPRRNVRSSTYAQRVVLTRTLCALDVEKQRERESIHSHLGVPITTPFRLQFIHYQLASHLNSS